MYDCSQRQHVGQFILSHWTCIYVYQRVKGGTYYPITVKKHLRAQEIAEQNRGS